MEPSLVAISSREGKQDINVLQLCDVPFTHSQNKVISAPIERNGLKEQIISSRCNSKNRRNISNRRQQQQQQTMIEVGYQKDQKEIKSDSLGLSHLAKTLEIHNLNKQKGLSKQNYILDKLNRDNQEDMSHEIGTTIQQKDFNKMKKHPILRKNQPYQEECIIINNTNNNNRSKTPEIFSNSSGKTSQDNKTFLNHQQNEQYLQETNINHQVQEGKYQSQLAQFLQQNQNEYSFVPLAISQPPQQPRLLLPTIIVAQKTQRPSSSVLKNISSTLDITTPQCQGSSCFEGKDQTGRLAKNIVINVLSNNKNSKQSQFFKRNMSSPQENNSNNQISLDSSKSFEETTQYTRKHQAIPKQSFISPCNNNIFPSWHSDVKSIRKLSPKQLKRQIQQKRQQQQQQYSESIMRESEKQEALRLISQQSQRTLSPENQSSLKDLNYRPISSVKPTNKQPQQDMNQQQYFKILDSGVRRHSQDLNTGRSQLSSARNYTHRAKKQEPLVTPRNVSPGIIDKRQVKRNNNNQDQGEFSQNNNSNDQYYYTPQKNSIHLQILSKLISNTSNSNTKRYYSNNNSTSHGRSIINVNPKLKRHNSAAIVNITLDNTIQQQDDCPSKEVKQKENNSNNKIDKSFPSNSNQGSSQTTLDIATQQEDFKEIILSSDDETNMSTPYCTYSMKKRRGKQTTHIQAPPITPSKEPQLSQTSNQAKNVQKNETNNGHIMVPQLGQIHALRKIFQKETSLLDNDMFVQSKLEQASQGSLIVRKLEEKDAELVRGVIPHRKRFEEQSEESTQDKRILNLKRSLLLDNCRSRSGCQKNQQQQINFTQIDGQISFNSETDRQDQLSGEVRVQMSRQKGRKFKRFLREGEIEPWQIQLSDSEKQDEEDICVLGSNN